MANLTLTCDTPNIGISELANNFINQMSNKAELVIEDRKKVESAEMVLIVFEEFFFRNNSYTTLTILFTQFNGVQTAKIVASGGGQGLINRTWGAHKEIINQATSILVEYNFK